MVSTAVSVFVFLVFGNAAWCAIMLRQKRQKQQVTSGYVFSDDPAPRNYARAIKSIVFALSLAVIALGHFALLFHGEALLAVQAFGISTLSWFYVALQ